MKSFKIDIGKDEPILINYHGLNTSKTCTVFIGGSGDDRNSLNGLVEKIIEKSIKSSICTFSFRGIETDKPLPAIEQITDLKAVLDYLTDNKNVKKISLVCTSMGAISTTYIATDKKYNEFLQKIIYLDPADYSSVNIKESETKTWTGVDKFMPEEAILSKKIKEITSEVKVYVVKFMLRNYGTNGYAEVRRRGVDDPTLSQRLNVDMVKAFFENTPKKNKAKYVELNDVPHAFIRDGDIEKNNTILADIVFELLVAG